jgi:hypothetical protein
MASLGFLPLGQRSLVLLPYHPHSEVEMNRLALAVLAVLFLGTPALAQQAAPFSHGLTVPMFSIRFDENDKGHANFLTEGAGYSFNFNMLPSDDGLWRRLTIGLPVFLQIPEQDNFSVSAGATIGTFNNLISIGCAIDLADLNPTGEDSGLFTGEFTKQNVAILMALNFNFGTGTATKVPSYVKFREAEPTPPPNYIKLW